MLTGRISQSGASSCVIFHFDPAAPDILQLEKGPDARVQVQPWENKTFRHLLFLSKFQQS